ncbi:MAG TPA: amidohydrolase family protein [Chloroflexia bacterium]|nr:amidohydrolase family protein [Chloroflexia bacterium]
MDTLLITNARLIDGTGTAPRDGTTVVVQDGRIVEVRHSGGDGSGEGAQVLDLEGRTLLPGLINAHCHVMMDASGDPVSTLARKDVAVAVLEAAGRARRMLEAGITTARDLGGYEYAELALRDAIARGEVPGPRLVCCGKLITMTGGQGWPVGLESDGPDEVRKAARKNFKRGADCLKFMATGGVLTPGVEPGSPQLGEEEMRAGVEEARHVGKHTASHAQGTEGVKNAIRAGVDTIEHGIFLDDEAIQMMIERGTVLVPTLAAPYQIIQAGAARGVPEWAIEKSIRVSDAHRKSFEWALAAGVTIAAGNDGGTPFNPSHDLVTEIRLMVDYGMNPLAAIRAATWGSAKAVGLVEETGTAQKGKWADLLVLGPGADPLEDIAALSDIEHVIKRGQVVV